MTLYGFGTEGGTSQVKCTTFDFAPGIVFSVDSAAESVSAIGGASAGIGPV